MTAAESYHAEMAKRGLTLTKATGCPRRQVSGPVLLVEPPKLRRSTKRDENRAARWAEWRKLYVTDGWGLKDIAEETGYSHSGIASALKKMGVALRPQGGGRTMAALIAENKRLTRDVQILKARLAGLRRREAA